MLPAAKVYRGSHLFFYVPPEEKVRLHDDTADRKAVPVAAPCCNSAGCIHNRFIQRWPGRGHEPQLDA